MVFFYEKFREDIIKNRSFTNRLSIRQAATQIGISAATLSRVETGRKIDVDTLFKILTWLNSDIKKYISYDTCTNANP